MGIVRTFLVLAWIPEIGKFHEVFGITDMETFGPGEILSLVASPTVSKRIDSTVPHRSKRCMKIH